MKPAFKQIINQLNRFIHLTATVPQTDRQRKLQSSPSFLRRMLKIRIQENKPSIKKAVKTEIFHEIPKYMKN